MINCVYLTGEDECTLYHGKGNERPSECDRNGICMGVENCSSLQCDMFDTDLPDVREE